MKNTSHITRYTQQKNKPRVTLSSKSQTPALSSIRWRRGLGRGGAFLLVSPLLGPLPTRSSRGEDGELDAAVGRRRFREEFALSGWNSPLEYGGGGRKKKHG